MTTPFHHMAATLASATAFPHPRAPGAQARGATRLGRIRDLLRDHGPLPAANIAVQTDLQHTSLVGALLKNDLHQGRVTLRAGRYHWNHSFDEAQAQRIKAAAQLLRRHGYTVKAPQ